LTSPSRFAGHTIVIKKEAEVEVQKLSTPKRILGNVTGRLQSDRMGNWKVTDQINTTLNKSNVDSFPKPKKAVKRSAPGGGFASFNDVVGVGKAAVVAAKSSMVSDSMMREGPVKKRIGLSSKLNQSKLTVLDRLG